MTSPMVAEQEAIEAIVDELWSSVARWRMATDGQGIGVYRGHAAQILNRLTALGYTQSRWLPIDDDTPRDGTPLWFWRRDSGVFGAEFIADCEDESGGAWFSSVGEDVTCDIGSTLYTPLPDPPPTGGAVKMSSREIIVDGVRYVKARELPDDTDVVVPVWTMRLDLMTDEQHRECGCQACIRWMAAYPPSPTDDATA